jgi:hypothetical protein
MAKVVLHVGAHKTGTTYLQNLFHHNRVRLAKVGVHYPNIGPNTAHHALARAWIAQPAMPPGFLGSRGADGLWDDIIARYADAPGIVFLSGENFMRCRPEQIDMTSLANRLSAFEDVRILYAMRCDAMRSQTEMVQSLWLQLARDRHPPQICDYVRDATNLRRARGVRIDHGTVYDTLLRGFTPEQIHFLDYRQARRMPGGLGQVVLDLLETGLTIDQLAQPGLEDTNISSDPLSYWVASQLAGEARPSHVLLNAVGAAFAATGRENTLLARPEFVKFASRYGDANTKLVERLQGTQPGFTFEESTPPSDIIYRDETPDAIQLDIAARIKGLPVKRYAAVGHGVANISLGRRVVRRLNLLREGRLKA